MSAPNPLDKLRAVSPQEDVLLENASGAQVVFDSVVEGVLQLVQAR